MQYDGCSLSAHILVDVKAIRLCRNRAGFLFGIIRSQTGFERRATGMVFCNMILLRRSAVYLVSGAILCLCRGQGDRRSVKIYIAVMLCDEHIY